MFERFDQGARRSIFYARAEADAYGASRIEIEHLLLALLREDKILCKDLLGGDDKIDVVRKEVGTEIARGQTSPKDTPLSDESKQALFFAVENADRAGLRQLRLRKPFKF